MNSAAKISVAHFLNMGFLVFCCAIQEPEIIDFPTEDIIVKEGEDVILPCVVPYIPARETEPVQWVRDKLGGLGRDRELKNYPRYSFIGNSEDDEYNLLISDVQVDDDDFYECQVTEHNLRSGKRKLTVLAPTKRLLINGAIGQPNMQLDVVQGKETTITCTSEGANPPAALRWYRNGLEIMNNATLNLTPTVDDRNATYTCVALNSSDQNQIFLKTSLTMNFIAKPTVTLRMSKPQTEGEDTTATCETEPSTADTKCRFYSNGRILPTTGCMLKINSTLHNLSCQAENIAGSSGFSEKLMVVVASTPDPEPRSASSIPIICSAVAAGIIIIIVSGLLYFRRRRDQNQMPGSPEEHEDLNERNSQDSSNEEKHSKSKMMCYHVTDIPSHACTPPSTDYGSDDSNVTSRQDEGYITSGTNYSTKSKTDPQRRFAPTPLLPEIVLPRVMEAGLSSQSAYAPSSLEDYPYHRPIAQNLATAYGARSQLASISTTPPPRIPNFVPNYSNYPYNYPSTKPNVDSELPLGADAADPSLPYDTSGRASNMSHASHSSRSTDSHPFVSKRATHV